MLGRVRVAAAPLIAVAALAAAGCGASGRSARERERANNTGGLAATSTAACRTDVSARPPGHVRLKPPPAGSPDATTVTLATSCGPIRIALDVRQPRTVASFTYLARRGFYDGLDFFRVARTPGGSPFVVVAGDPEATGRGGPGYTVVERPQGSVAYVRGTVAMLRPSEPPGGLGRVSAPGTSASTFFIVTADDADLPPEYAVVGHVSGSDLALRRIASLPTAGRVQRPVHPPVIERVSVH
jgi:peptidyl-prolyl cis-trans isomerase B (cyclophilin B)